MPPWMPPVSKLLCGCSRSGRPHRPWLSLPPCSRPSLAGVDALGSLLALSLSGVPPASMAAAAFGAVLRHPELTAALTAAETVDEDELEEQQRAAGGDVTDAAAVLEQVGVRPELAAALAGGPAGAGFFTGWALLLAHMLAAPADSHGRRLLAQSVKEAHALVPTLMDALVPLLPLDAGSGGRRRDSSGSASGVTPGPAAAVVTAGAGGGGSTSGGAGSSFASQLAEVGPFPSSAAGAAAEAVPPTEQQAAQRFVALLYAAVLQGLPASARLWFADLRDRGTAAATERYTSGAVSGQLLAAELAAVSEAAKAFGKFDKFSVRANATSREVIAGELRTAQPAVLRAPCVCLPSSGLACLSSVLTLCLCVPCRSDGGRGWAHARTRSEAARLHAAAPARAGVPAQGALLGCAMLRHAVAIAARILRRPSPGADAPHLCWAGAVQVGVSEGRLRKWLLSISAFLRTQNGSVAEAISLWKRNVDKEFEGGWASPWAARRRHVHPSRHSNSMPPAAHSWPMRVLLPAGQEECLICYSIIQPTSGQLPRLSCRTCRKRFHGAAAGHCSGRRSVQEPLLRFLAC